MITKELIEDAKAAGIEVPRIKVTDPKNRFGPHAGGFNYDYEFLGRIAKVVKLQLQRQRERQAVPDGWIPTDSEVAAWNERNDNTFQDRLHLARAAIYDARSMHLIAAAQSPELISPHPINQETGK